MTASAKATRKSSPQRTARRRGAAPRVGFVSLGCPKALVDSERILTQLRAEGYAISPTYDGADLVVVNTCGFIETAVDESLSAIGEALNANGKVIVTGCLGAKGDIVRKTHPSVLPRIFPAGPVRSTSSGCGARGSSSTSWGRVPQRCEPGIMRVAPFSVVKSSSIQMVLQAQ